METSKQVSLQPNAVQDLKTLSFCKPTVKDLSAWIKTLPKANFGELSRLLYQAFAELNRLMAPQELRFQMLEVLRPEVSYITTQLEKSHLSKTVILDERARKVANLCQTLQSMQTTGYKICIDQAGQNANAAFIISIQRAIHSLYSSLVRAYQLYYPVPAGLWQDLHQLFQLAQKHRAHQRKLKDPLHPELSENNIENAYICALLLGSARINQMRQSDIVLVASLIPYWAHMADLLDFESNEAIFVIAPQSDNPPRYKALLNLKNTSGLIGFDSKKIAGELNQWLKKPQDRKLGEILKIPANTQPNVIAALASAWGDIAKRDFKRTPGTGTLEVCLGLTAVNYYLADKTPFEQLIKKEDPIKASFKMDNSAPDIWGNAFDAQGGGNDFLADEFIEFSGKNDKENTFEHETLYPTFQIAIVNHSPGGYCLEWGEDAPNQLQAGDILALRTEGSQQWSTGVIRWIRQIRNGGAQIGVELLSPNAQPCAIQLIRQGEKPSNFLRGLLIPAIAVVSQAATVITPRIPFQEGSRVSISHDSEEFKAILGKRSIHTASISRYEYRLSEQPAPDMSMAIDPGSTAALFGGATKTTKPQVQGATFGSDFDSLWKTL